MNIIFSFTLDNKLGPPSRCITAGLGSAGIGALLDGFLSPKNGDDQALSESELESRRAALLAQLSEQLDE